MRTKQINLLKFNELSKEAKELAIEQNNQINTDYDWWKWIEEEWREKLEKLGYANAEIFFSGFYSQGDGACFTAEVVIEKWVKTHKKGQRIAKLLAELNAGDLATITIKNNGRDSYATSTTVEYEGLSELSDKAYNQLEEVVQWIKEERETLGNELYQELQSNYEDLSSAEAISETLLANDCDFLKSGVMPNF